MKVVSIQNIDWYIRNIIAQQLETGIRVIHEVMDTLGEELPDWMHKHFSATKQI